MNDVEKAIPRVRVVPRTVSPLVYAVAIALVLALVPQFASPFQRILLAYGLIMGIAALGFNLLLGYTGLLSFGHSAFFGVAAYTVGLLMKYLHVASMEGLLAAGIIASFLTAAVFGFVCVRYTRIFFSILTLALSQVLWGLAFKFYWITGGTDGLPIPTPRLLGGLISTAGGKLQFLSVTYFYYVLAIFLMCAGVMWVIVNSPFGMALQAIRDNETRAEFVGVQVKTFRWVAFMISGGFTGLAGVLWAPLNGLTTPEVLHWQFSGKIVFMAVLGGFKSFAGPVLGAVAYNYLEAWVIARTVYWQGLLGLILVALVLLMPRGLVGLLAWVTRWQKASN
jgi:branched-chain amino acid transport system permease protein